MTQAQRPRADPLVELRGVVKTYREGGQQRTVFDDLNVAFERGAISAIVGRSGSGKSTLLNLVSGIDLPDAGDVRFDGELLNHLSEKERTLKRRRDIGFVFQFFNLIQTLTVEENLTLPLELNGRDREAAAARVAELLSAVGLVDRRKSFPDQLSGGEQQRIAVVRAVIHDPTLVVADEPTGNLDADTGRQVLDLLCNLARDSGKTLLMVTHSEEAAQRADYVFAVDAGRLRDRGDYQEAELVTR